MAEIYGAITGDIAAAQRLFGKGEMFNNNNNNNNNARLIGNRLCYNEQ